jgi:hypothetical protein
LHSGCSRIWCSWREGKRVSAPRDDYRQSVLEEMKAQPADASDLFPIVNGSGSKIEAVRRKSAETTRRVAELEALQKLHVQLQLSAQKHIDHLEWKTGKALADFERLQQENARLSEELQEMRAQEVNSTTDPVHQVALPERRSEGRMLPRLQRLLGRWSP